MKYVMFSNGEFILFPNSMKHSDFRNNGNPKSAGFCKLKPVVNEFGETKYNVHCYGRSESLNLDSDPEHDDINMTIGLNVP